MLIQIDTREKPKAIEKIVETFDKEGIKYIRSKCYVGDYVNLDNPKIAIDRKQNLNEVCLNVVQDHRRFAEELKRANEVGIHMIILVEHGKDIKTMDDIKKWVNPRLKESPNAVSGERLYKIVKTMSDYYNTDFVFCTKSETGKKIIELLEEQNEVHELYT